MRRGVPGLATNWRDDSTPSPRRRQTCEGCGHARPTEPDPRTGMDLCDECRKKATLSRGLSG